jgi:hypothetical protein
MERLSDLADLPLTDLGERLDRWRGFNCVEATIITGGALWGMKNLTQD